MKIEKLIAFGEEENNFINIGYYGKQDAISLRVSTISATTQIIDIEISYSELSSLIDLLETTSKEIIKIRHLKREGL
jgi:hypothetical protein